MRFEAGQVTDYEEGKIKAFRFKKYNVCVAKKNDTFYSFRNACPHQFVPLADGFLGEGQVTCCLHGWQFDLVTGKCEIAPEMTLPIYTVVIEDDNVFVEIEDK